MEWCRYSSEKKSIMYILDVFVYWVGSKVKGGRKLVLISG